MNNEQDQLPKDNTGGAYEEAPAPQEPQIEPSTEADVAADAPEQGYPDPISMPASAPSSFDMVGATFASAPVAAAPVVETKTSKKGLIIGVIIAAVVLVGGGVAAFLMFGPLSNKFDYAASDDAISSVNSKWTGLKKVYSENVGNTTSSGLDSFSADKPIDIAALQTALDDYKSAVAALGETTGINGDDVKGKYADFKEASSAKVAKFEKAVSRLVLVNKAMESSKDLENQFANNKIPSKFSEFKAILLTAYNPILESDDEEFKAYVNEYLNSTSIKYAYVMMVAFSGMGSSITIDEKQFLIDNPELAELINADASESVAQKEAEELGMKMMALFVTLDDELSIDSSLLSLSEAVADKLDDGSPIKINTEYNLEPVAEIGSESGITNCESTVDGVTVNCALTD